ncbi:MAG: ribosome biogenesis GTP-binding protein YihA/YsxC [Bacteroidota bacterium]
MQIKTATYHSSHSRVNKLPPEGTPEFAFIGRSNVGKSSLINMLVERKELAHTSSKPGKTQLISYFKINDSWFLTDLPGYGYARVSKKTRGKWETRTENYFSQRRSLVNAFVLIDSGIPPQKIDLEFCNWLGELGVPFSLVFTKVDRKKSRDGGQVAKFKAALLESWEELPPCFATSAMDRTGRDDILDFIEATLTSISWPAYAT